MLCTCMFVGGIPKSKSVEMIEEETLQDQRETPVSVPPIPPSPRGEKQFAGKFKTLKSHYRNH